MQERLFQLVKSNYNNKEKLIADLMKLLSISRSAVYKRLSGNILLNLKEVSSLIEHYGIDSYALFQKKNGTVYFKFPPLDKDVNNQNDFLKPIIQDLQILQTAPDARFYFLATGFPIFYFFLHKEIAQFKFYTFKNSVWDSPNSKIKKFSLKENEHNLEQIAQYDLVRALYANIDSEEVWTGNILQTTLEEIKSYLESGLFEDPNDAMLLIDKLFICVEEIHQMVQMGNKSLMTKNGTGGGELMVYHNNFGRFGSNILTRSAKGSKVYSTYDLPNYLVCEDQDFIDYTMNWMKQIKNKSLPLTASSDFEQIKFFNKIKDYIHQSKEEMLSKKYF